MSVPTIAQQIQAVGWAVGRGEIEAQHNRYPADPELGWLRAALVTLERYERVTVAFPGFTVEQIAAGLTTPACEGEETK